MLMQQAEVHSSAGSTFDCIHSYVAGAASAFECNRGAFKCRITLLVLTGACARMQKSVWRVQVRGSEEKAQVHSIARTAFDRTIGA
jgi:hypothetical protein